jgi:hypothetical protein
VFSPVFPLPKSTVTDLVCLDMLEEILMPEF